MTTLDMQHYLSRLLSFANLRADVPDPQQPDGKRALKVEDLESTYVQAFSQLAEATNLSVAMQPVSQVRVAIGVLRVFMDDQQEPVDLSPYGLAAYESMLQILVAYLLLADNVLRLLPSVCVMSISRAPARQTCFQHLVQPSWPASEHTSATRHHDHEPAPLLRPSAAGGPRGHAIEQHFTQRPHLIGQARRPRRRPGPPHLG
jgi:hypothetical protein